MKKIKLITFAFIALFFVACKDDVQLPDYTEWRNENLTYFNNMKDSVGFVHDSVNTNLGYIDYYYKIVNQGDTSTVNPTYTDYVKVNYRGQDIKGNIFDQTYKGTSPLNDSTATPYTFYNANLIVGWTANLMQMKEGEIRTVILPYVLAYGTAGNGSILPYSTLRFDIQLINVLK